MVRTIFIRSVQQYVCVDRETHVSRSLIKQLIQCLLIFQINLGTHSASIPF